MNTKKIILGLALIIGIIVFIILAYIIIIDNKGNEWQKTILGTLFTTIGASIAILLDVKPDPNTDQAKPFNRLTNAVAFSKEENNSSEYIGIVYAVVYFFVGVYTLSKAGGANNEYITSLATAFIGIIIAVVGKYALASKESSNTNKISVFIVFCLLSFCSNYDASGQDIEIDLDNMNTTTTFKRKGSTKLIVANIDKTTKINVTSKKMVYTSFQPFSNLPTILDDGKRFEVYIINLDIANSVDVKIEIKKGDQVSEFSFIIYKEKYWDVSVSAGLFYSAIRSKKIGWQTLNQNELISNLDTTGLFSIYNNESNINHGGLSTLSHLIYQYSPSFGIGAFTGLGVSFTDKVVPQIQFGVSLAVLKGRRLLLNLGLSTSFGTTGHSPFVSQTSKYTHIAIKQFDLNDHIEKGFGLLGPSISITYQITN